MSGNVQFPAPEDHPDFEVWHGQSDNSNETPGWAKAAAGVILALVAIVIIMLVIKLGLVLFT